ncbi:MAG TPA: hypothetical protein VGL88_12885 [Pseudonocardiaceae bacterium]
MSVVDDLNRLAELREHGHLTAAEFDEVKQRLIERSPAPEAVLPSEPDGSLLLYRLVSSWLKRAAAAMAVVAVLFGAVAGWSTLHYVNLHGQALATQDETIARPLGVRIPDPRPTIERAALEAQATAYGGLAITTGLIALGALAGALLIRPPRPSLPPASTTPTTALHPRSAD